MSDATFIIIGAGHAGIRAAVSLRKSGFDGHLIMVAEEGNDLPYERPPLSKWSSEENSSDIEIKPIFSPEVLAEANIEMIDSRVTHIDRENKTVHLADGQNLKYSKLLLATGARARELKIAGCDQSAIFHLRDRKDAAALKTAAANATSAIIIGGGFIGLELAASLIRSGIKVDVIEMADRLLGRAVSENVAKIVQNLHEDNGVNFHFGSNLTGYVFSEDAHVITLANNTVLRADLLIAGIGSIANTELAEDAKLDVENGIVVDHQMRTSDPDIFAAGDCCSFPLYGDVNRRARLESWQASGEQGNIAASNMFSTSDDQRNCSEMVPWFWSEQYDHVLQVTGLSSVSDKNVERTYGEDHHITFTSDENDKLCSACGIAPQTKIAKDIRFAMKIIAGKKRILENELADSAIALKTLAKK